MKRWVYFFFCVIFAAGFFAAGWLLPVYLRAVDIKVIERAGRTTPGIIEEGLALVEQKNLGPAELLSQAAQREQIPGHEKLRGAIEDSLKANPNLQNLGANSRLKALLNFSLKNQPATPREKITPFTSLIIQTENRERALTLLRASPNPIVQQLLRCRALTNTVLFPPSKSSSGQAFDAALATGGLLLEGQHLTRSLINVISSNSDSALRGEDSRPLEQILLDLMSLGQRFNWGQLVSFCEDIDNPETLRLHANLARKDDAQLPILFSAVQLSGKPDAVANYLIRFSETGQKDLSTSLRFGVGGVNELLKRNQRLHHSSFQGKLNGASELLVYLPWQMPELALGLKWILFLCAGFLFALALHFARPRTPSMERQFHVRGFHVAREILFALGFLLVVLLLSEPFLAQEAQKVEFPIRLQLATVSSAVSSEITGVKGSIMNQLSLFTLLLFFVLQALIYVGCLVKLAEIRRQTFASRIKLKLLENEDNFFDAGLYLGFAGTIVSLILVSMGVIKPSLMAAYSSTAFGVIFVSVFKIFHLRPLRRKLLLEAEAAKDVSTRPTETAFTSPL